MQHDLGAAAPLQPLSPPASCHVGLPPFPPENGSVVPLLFSNSAILGLRLGLLTPR